jgi:hypothetical protein
MRFAGDAFRIVGIHYPNGTNSDSTVSAPSGPDSTVDFYPLNSQRGD